MMDFGVKGVADLGYVAGKLDGGATCTDLDSLESLARQPVGDGLDIGVGGTVEFSKILGREPLMKIWRVFAKLFVHELAETSLLFGAALKKEQDAVHWRGVGNDALIKFRACEGMDVAVEAYELRFIDRLGDPSGNGGGLCSRYVIQFGLGGGAKRRERQNQSKKEEGIAKDQRMEFHIPPTPQI